VAEAKAFAWLAKAAQGGRNIALNNAAFRMATMIARGWIGRADVGDALYAACQANGLVSEDGDDSVQATMASGLRAGASEPHPDLEERPREDIGADRQRDQQRRQGQEPPQKHVFNAERLNQMTFSPIKYVVHGYIVEGLTLFAGKPKIGKSWLLLDAAIAVARDDYALGGVKCAEGDVLYCALEDNLRRLQSRLTKLLGAQPWPRRLWFKCEIPRLTEGGLDYIKNWIEAAAHPRLVIIDTLAMVRTPSTKNQSMYDADYTAVKDLRAVANKYGVAIVLVHHLRKQDADDAFDVVSGTLGLTGAPDTILIIKRDVSGATILHGRGRDLVELEKVLVFNKDACTWSIVGDAQGVRQSSERALILEALDEAGEAIGPNAIASTTGMKAVNVRRLLSKLAHDGAIEKAGYGKYRRRVGVTNP
jgi:hypothetical protein